MIAADAFCNTLKQLGFRFFVGVPCSFFQHATNAIVADPDMTYIAAANEGAAVGIAAGAVLTGTKSALLMQNSGLGNAVNPITSLLLIYRIPMLLFVSGRAYPAGQDDEPQHAIMGTVTQNLLTQLGVESREMPDTHDDFVHVLRGMDEHMACTGLPVAFIVRKGTIEDRPAPVPLDAWDLRRIDVIRAIADAAIRHDAAVIATTGHISRELFAVADRPANFYMQGSMGHASAIGLGAALSRRDRRVVVLDGDGAVIMHLGTLSTIGHYAPDNLIHVVLDNEAYESTGNQDTTSRTTAVDAVARASGYRHAVRCTSASGLVDAVEDAFTQHGPTLILVKVSRQPSLGTPRITTRYTPHHITQAFAHSLARAR